MATSPPPACACFGGAESAIHDVFGGPRSLPPTAQTPELALPVPLAPFEPAAAYSAPPPIGSSARDATDPEFDRFSVDNPPRIGHVLARGTTPPEVIVRYAHDYATAVGFTQKHLADNKNAEGIPRRLRIQCGHSGKPAPCLKASTPAKRRAATIPRGS
eukprot:jgi/Tetstr1/434148/TSEL_002472.t1